MRSDLTNTNGPIYFVMGVSGSGKTTVGSMLAEALHFPFYDGDDYHSEENVAKMAAGHPLTDKDRQGWLKRLNSLAKENLREGAIIVCSALKESYRDILSRSIENKVSWLFLQGSAKLISERLHKRKGHFMPSGLLQSQFNTLEVPDDGIIIDIAGTPEGIVKDILARIGRE
jgi:carbohydrate kinase (thermoresistant glucokinase family)